MGELSNIEKLRWHCYKIIPLVFDEALSYYEVICKCGKKTNEVIDFINELSTQVNKNTEEIAAITGGIDLTELKEQVDDNTNNIEDLQDSLSDLGGRVTALEDLGAVINIDLSGSAEQLSPVNIKLYIRSGSIDQGIKDLTIFAPAEAGSSYLVSVYNHMHESYPTALGAETYYINVIHLHQGTWYKMKICYDPSKSYNVDYDRTTVTSF